MASSLGNEYAYFHYMIAQEMLIDDSTLSSYIWLLIAILTFSSGAFFFSVSRRQHSVPPQSYQSIQFFASQIDQNAAVKALCIAFFATFLVAFSWVGSAIFQFGGVTKLMSLAASENRLAREVLLNASFPGGRLISSGFIGIAVYSAALIGAGRSDTSIRKSYLVGCIYILAMAYLAVIPILLSGRINFFVAMIGSLVAYSYSSRRLISGRYVILGVGFLVAVWTAKEYFVLGHIANDVTVASQGLEGLAFYIYNDLLNVLNTIGKFDGNYTYGWYSLKFVFFFTFTDKEFFQYIAEAREALGYYVTAGEIPLLGAPFVDFGVFGFIVLFGLGFWVQYAYFQSARNIAYVAIYGLLFAGLILSVHSSYITSQEVIYSVLLVRLLARISQKTQRESITT